ncbi:hypothetical protein TNCV_2434011 [Trichonephila clavipes]|nr:hypothetical protein TNCV_2434011 [Trichonephila clavipes]
METDFVILSRCLLTRMAPDLLTSTVHQPDEFVTISRPPKSECLPKKHYHKLNTLIIIIKSLSKFNLSKKYPQHCNTLVPDVALTARRQP